jgi:hypothetical protein
MYRGSIAWGNRTPLLRIMTPTESGTSMSECMVRVGGCKWRNGSEWAERLDGVSNHLSTG